MEWGDGRTEKQELPENPDVPEGSDWEGVETKDELGLRGKGGDGIVGGA